jgi:hypothetical protein
MPALRAPIFELRPAAENHDGPHGHSKQTEPIGWEYLPFMSTVVVTGSGSSTTPITWGYRPIMLRLNGFSMNEFRWGATESWRG